MLELVTGAHRGMNTDDRVALPYRLRTGSDPHGTDELSVLSR